MEGEKYKVSLNIHEANYQEVLRQAKGELKDTCLENQIALVPTSFSVGNYGVSPIADRDSRTFLRVSTPDGEQLLPVPGSDIPLRYTFGRTSDLVKDAVTAIHHHQSRALS